MEREDQKHAWHFHKDKADRIKHWGYAAILAFLKIIVFSHLWLALSAPHDFSYSEKKNLYEILDLA